MIRSEWKRAGGIDPDKTVATGSFRTAGLKGDSHTKRYRWQSSLSFPLEPLS
jgi:hypothetical protein